MKYASYAGIAAALFLILCCFIPWAYYPDLNQNFTGFYSEQNQYGKPGKAFIFLSVVSIFFFLMPRIWAKRANQFIGVLIFAYAMKTYFTYSACYLGICPAVKFGLIGMLVFSLIILVCGLLSQTKLRN